MSTKNNIPDRFTQNIFGEGSFLGDDLRTEEERAEFIRKIKAGETVSWTNEKK